MQESTEEYRGVEEVQGSTVEYRGIQWSTVDCSGVQVVHWRKEEYAREYRGVQEITGEYRGKQELQCTCSTEEYRD